MMNLVATTPKTAKAMKNLYAELNRQKELKRTYRRRYKDLQTVVTTSADTSATPSHPIPTSGNNKTTPNVPVGKQVTPGAQKKAPDKNKTKPSSKGKKNPTKPTTTTASSAVLHSQSKDRAKHTVALIQELVEELQANEDESTDEEHELDAIRASALEQKDTDVPVTEDEQ